MSLRKYYGPDVSTNRTPPDPSQVGPAPRLRFGEFVLSPRQRVLWRNGVALPLIPRYFDLLHLLVSRRREAVSKSAIFTEVWTEVVVSDGALAQAVRTLRRTLEDDSREPRFIRTVSRHGYQFVWLDVVEEPDDERLPLGAGPIEPVATEAELREALINRLLQASTSVRDHDGEEAREVAERLHALGTEAAVASLTSRPGHAEAMALLKDARWDVPGARDVPLFAHSEALQTTWAVIRLRLRHMQQTVAARWASAAGVGALGGALAGSLGGFALWLAPGSSARAQSAVALAAIGLVAGGIGAAGVGAGLAAAEAVARSRRGLALTLCGAAAGGATGAFAQWLFVLLLDSLFGLRLPAAGAPIDGLIDGLVMGALAGAGYAWATRQPPGGGLAAPKGRRRLAAVALVGASCALAAVGLAVTGRPLVGGRIHQVAQASRDSELGLAPLGRVIGEPDFGPLARTLLGAFEGGIFGCALGWGLTYRPRSTRP